MKKNIDTERFYRLKDIIYKSLSSYKEKHSSYVDDVKKMYLSGKKQFEIIKELGCAKSTVCEIIKRYNLK